MGLFDDIRTGNKKKKDLFELKEIAKEEREKIFEHKIQEVVKRELEKSGFHGRIDEMGRKIGDMEKMVGDIRKSFAPISRVKEDGVRKMKMKRMITELLRKHRKLTANDVSVMLNLSRTRSSEYLAEMERQEMAKGSLVKRQKFYELADRYKS